MPKIVPLVKGMRLKKWVDIERAFRRGYELLFNWTEKSVKEVYMLDRGQFFFRDIRDEKFVPSYVWSEEDFVEFREKLDVSIFETEEVNEDALNYFLCYVTDNELYFTDDMRKVNGPGWIEQTYEENSGPPYKKFISKKVFYETNTDSLKIRFPRHGFSRSPYTVADLNRKRVPWMTMISSKDGVQDIQIFAGISYKKLRETVSGINFYELK
jgi:hypothetical protein